MRKGLLMLSACACQTGGLAKFGRTEEAIRIPIQI